MTSTQKGTIFAVAAMAVIVTVSNILVQVPFNTWLTWGAFTYPFAFLVTDLANRLHGPAVARRVVLAGFGLAVLLSIWFATPRIALASGTAFLVAQMLDVAVFDRLRQGSWWRAPAVSSLLGSAVDTALFFSLAFAPAFAFLGDDTRWAQEQVPLLGIGAPVAFWVGLAVGDFLVKLALIGVALVPFRLILGVAAPSGATGR
ncbi:MAG: queuosine precursor transporter [Pseudomonadota bacterium]